MNESKGMRSFLKPDQSIAHPPAAMTNATELQDEENTPASQHDNPRDLKAFKRSAILYWERRRIIYNILIGVPSVFVYFGGTDIAAGIGDRARLDFILVLLLFLLSAVVANICYTFAYALEFLLGSVNPESWWLRYGRTVAFAVGTIFSMGLAVQTGHGIFLMQYPV